MPETLTVKEVIAAIESPIERVRPSPGYLLGLAISTTTVLLLPVVYLGLIGLIGYGVVMYAIHAVVIFEGSGGGRIILVKGIAYVAPIVAGSIVVLLMLKPLIARSTREVNPYDIHPGQEPAFFTFVKYIADAVGAPTPARIELTCEPNASASFRRGLFSFFGRDLTLRIGTPLIACLNADQLGGIIAHELGHFTQGFAMRCGYLTAVIMSWFSRVIDHRDTWDDAIDDMIESETWFGVVIGLTAKFGVALSRLTLRLFRLIAAAATCFTSRRMEFNADLAQIRLAGSSVFRTTFDQLGLAAHAFEFTLEELAQNRVGSRLPNDIPALTRSRLLVMPPDFEAYLKQTQEAERTQILSTHPPTRLRIQQAEREQEPGVLTLDVPAERLFRNPAVLCQWTTVGLYRDWFGLAVSAEDLDPVERVVRERQQIHSAREAIGRAWPTLDDPAQLSPLVSRHSIKDGQARAMQLKATRALEQHRDRAEAACKTLRTIARQRDGLITALSLVSLDRKVPAVLVDGMNPEPEALNRQRAKLDAAVSTPRDLCDEYAGLLALRLDGVRRGMTAGHSQREELDADLERVARISRNRERLGALQAKVSEAKALIGAMAAQRNDPRPNARFESLGNEVRVLLMELRDDLHRGDPWQALESLADQIVESIPPVQMTPKVFAAASAVVPNAVTVYSEAIGRLVLLAEKTEAAA